MKNIESNFNESRKYKPNPKFVELATITEEILAGLHKNFENNPDLFR